MVIEGKIATILNTRELALNKRADDGVEMGMTFEVLDFGVDVIDPDSEDMLGRLARPKLRVEIVHIEPRFSVGKTFDTYQQPNVAAALSAVLSPKFITKVKTIREGEDQEFSEGSVSVSVGDPVVQLEQHLRKLKK